MPSSASELPHFVWENFPLFEDLWDSQPRKRTFLMFSFPPPVPLGAGIWLRLRQADTCANMLNWKQMTWRNTDPLKRLFWHCNQPYFRHSFHRPWCWGSSQPPGSGLAEQAAAWGPKQRSLSRPAAERDFSYRWFQLGSLGPSPFAFVAVLWAAPCPFNTFLFCLS